MGIQEYIEPETDISSLKYSGKGEAVYADGRQVLVRACHDAAIGIYNDKGEKGIMLVRRRAEPAKDYLWFLGGGIERGVPIFESLKKKIKLESGLEISNPILLTVGRFMWNTTPNYLIKEKNLPRGIDDIGLLFYCEGNGNFNLDNFHESPLIITPQMYTHSFKKGLHPYVKQGIELSMPFLK